MWTIQTTGTDGKLTMKIKPVKISAKQYSGNLSVLFSWQGNIRVFCRVRPLLGDECAHGEEIHHLNFPDDDGKILEMDKVADVSLNEVGPSLFLKHGGIWCLIKAVGLFSLGPHNVSTIVLCVHAVDVMHPITLKSQSTTQLLSQASQVIR